MQYRDTSYFKLDASNKPGLLEASSSQAVPPGKSPSLRSTSLHVEGTIPLKLQKFAYTNCQSCAMSHLCLTSGLSSISLLPSSLTLPYKNNLLHRSIPASSNTRHDRKNVAQEITKKYFQDAALLITCLFAVYCITALLSCLSQHLQES